MAADRAPDPAEHRPHRPAAARFRHEGLRAQDAETLATELIALWRGLQMTLILTQDPSAVARVQSQALDGFCARAQAGVGT